MMLSRTHDRHKKGALAPLSKSLMGPPGNLPCVLFSPPQDYPGAPAPTDEESITFKSFLDSLDKGLVAKVDFLAGGNKAYAFVKPSASGEATRIRVGEGYPDEQGDGWSSPLWVVRALNDRNVSD